MIKTFCKICKVETYLPYHPLLIPFVEGSICSDCDWKLHPENMKPIPLEAL